MCNNLIGSKKLLRNLRTFINKIERRQKITKEMCNNFFDSKKVV